ncbi:glycosyltransferase family 4 protein [Magnetospirillum moscoviense]|uniref:Alpha-mannosyltransferase n=1 Tax=Magnetospirillum moscoviense TaxID=1437059 RepID=A0A178MR50_9PROT|nr:glycosyltransferase family 1 protein [Magnetospirillum moscoviense]OAN50414.1 alpha-mannosyltransferase [Magnetospirillum moscoviense]
MRIVVVSDAWFPQVNGVVRTLDTLKAELERTGHQVVMVTPDLFRSVACPTYPEIRLALAPSAKLARLIEAAQPCAIHIATEGPLGWAARRFCRRRHLPFTSAYHTKFPEYVRARFGVPLGLSYRVMRRFHDASARVMVATRSIENELTARGFSRIGRWSRGVDTDLFRPRPECRGEHGPLAGLARPIFLSVGRVAVEKNIEAFLALDLPGSKVVVGDGPLADELKHRHPEAHFVGARFGEDLARHYAAADVFVFPSMTDTFGLVLLEALASGLPVAAYPVPGPLDVLTGSDAGILDTDLGKAARAALAISPEDCRAHAMGFSWAAATQQFLANLQPFDPVCSPDPAPHLTSMA